MPEAVSAPNSSDDHDAAGPSAETVGLTRGRIDMQLRCLDRLAEIGMHMAEQVDREITAPPAGALASAEGRAAELQRLSLTLERASRAVHVAFLVQARLVAELNKLQTAAAGQEPLKVEIVRLSEEEADAQDAAAAQPRERRRHIREAVRRVAFGEGRSLEDAERLVRQASQRLDLDKIYGDVLSRPVSELIADICRDLGLSPDWPALADEDWALQELASGRPGAPLAAVQPALRTSTPRQPSSSPVPSSGPWPDPAPPPRHPRPRCEDP